MFESDDSEVLIDCDNANAGFLSIRFRHVSRVLLISVHNIKLNTVIEIVNERKGQRGCTTARLKTDVALMFVKINVWR